MQSDQPAFLELLCKHPASGAADRILKYEHIVQG
jgi:hypothetical protein